EAKAFAKEVQQYKNIPNWIFQNFWLQIIDGARKLQAQVVAGNKPNLAELKEKAQSAINKYKALSDAAKEDLQKQFPILTSVFKRRMAEPSTVNRQQSRDLSSFVRGITSPLNYL
ncbi:unnamed protein product, partial [Cylicostephanus goldi]